MHILDYKMDCLEFYLIIDTLMIVKELVMIMIQEKDHGKKQKFNTFF